MPHLPKAFPEENYFVVIFLYENVCDYPSLYFCHTHTHAHTSYTLNTHTYTCLGAYAQIHTQNISDLV
jgi:hypothetical protein